MTKDEGPRINRPPGQPIKLSTITLDLLRQHLADGGPARLLVSGDSMRPLIAAGDEVIIEPVERDGLHIGDVVAVDAGGHLLIHRLLAWEGDRLVTRGDALLAPDGPWPLERLLGRVHMVLKVNEQPLKLDPGSAPRGLRFLWRMELMTYRLAQALKRRLLGSRPCRSWAAIAWFISAPSRYWLCHWCQRIRQRING